MKAKLKYFISQEVSTQTSGPAQSPFQFLVLGQDYYDHPLSISLQTGHIFLGLAKKTRRMQ